jgi:hypothetical protein
MGANAQTAVPAFTAGQVLTAAQMTEVNTGIPVFATTTTRDAAFGGSGEKTLAQGQTCYIEATSTYQTYNGSAWVTFPNGLTLVKTQTVGSAVGSVAVTGAFSSTYDNYLVTMIGGTISNSASVNMQLGASTTGYYGGLVFANTSGTVIGAGNNNGANAQHLGGGGAGQACHVSCQVLGPNLAAYTKFVNGAYQNANNFGNSAQEHRVATAYTDFTLIPGEGTLTGGTIRVYGYANS